MGIKIHKKQKRNISYKKQIQCNNSCRNTLYPSSQNIKKCCSKIWKGRERDETAVFIHRLYDFILGRKSAIKLPLSIMPPPSVISLPFKGKKVYTPLKGCKNTLTKNAFIVHLFLLFLTLHAGTGCIHRFLDFLIMLVFQSRISN